MRAFSARRMVLLEEVKRWRRAVARDRQALGFSQKSLALAAKKYSAYEENLRRSRPDGHDRRFKSERLSLPRNQYESVCHMERVVNVI